MSADQLFVHVDGLPMRYASISVGVSHPVAHALLAEMVASLPDGLTSHIGSVLGLLPHSAVSCFPQLGPLILPGIPLNNVMAGKLVHFFGSGLHDEDLIARSIFLAVGREVVLIEGKHLIERVLMLEQVFLLPLDPLLLLELLLLTFSNVEHHELRFLHDTAHMRNKLVELGRNGRFALVVILIVVE